MKKYLRSILCLLLALCMVMCFAACSDDDDDEDEESIAGNYAFHSMTSEGITMDADALETTLGATADEFFIILNKDGTGTICFAGEVEEITWDEEELTDSYGDSIAYTIDGNLLSLEVEGVEMTFKKTSKKLEVPENPEVPEEQEEVEPTSTTYGIYAMTMDGTTMSGSDLAAAGITATNTYVTLKDDGTATLSSMGEVEEMGWNNAGMWPQSDPSDVAAITFDGDVLTISAEGFAMVFLKNGSMQVPELPQASTTSVAGTYELYSMSDGTTTYDYETINTLVLPTLEMESMEQFMSLTLNDDGTAKMIAMGVEADMEYDETTLWPKGQQSEALAYTLADGYLTFEMEGYTYTFAQK